MIQQALIVVFLISFALSVQANTELLDKIRQEDFQFVSNTIGSYEADAYSTVANEENLYILLDQLSEAITEDDLAYVEKWINKDSHNYLPYLLKGMYLSDLGWRHRGNKYIRYTREENLAKMRATFVLAESALFKAIERNPRAFSAYCDLISIYFAIGDGKTKAADIYHRGIKINPGSIKIRSRYLHFLVPKWGISAEKRLEFVREIEELARQDEKFKIILSYHYAQIADMYEDNYNASSAFYDKALSYGYQCEIHRDKAYMLFNNKLYKNALDELNLLVEKCPGFASAYLIRGRTLHKLGDERAGLLNLDMALSLSPGDAQILGTRGYVHLREKRYEQAIEDLTRALSKDQTTRWIWDNRGYAYYRLNMYQQAIADYSTAIEIDEYYSRAYRRKGDVYRKMKDYEKAMDSYSAGLEKSPDNIRLLLRRARLNYRHFSNPEAALKDLDHVLALDPAHKKAMKLHYKINNEL